MPIYTYKPKDKDKGCKFCKNGFEFLHRVNDKALTNCPKCKTFVIKVFSEFSVGFSKLSMDQKAKEKGFHKLKRVDKGKYEKLY